MADERRRLDPETLAITGGREDQGGALAPLLWGSTTFETETADQAAALAASVDPARFYSRHGNPGVRAFETAVAELEGGADSRHVVLDSPHGHDGFLIETESVGGVVGEFLTEIEKSNGAIDHV